MGKSPGKWIRAVLFGKKAFKSSKRREIPKSAYEKSLAASVEEPGSALGVDPSFTSVTAPANIAGGNENLDPGNEDVCRLPDEEQASSMQDGNAQTVSNDGLPYYSDGIFLEQAATKAQATFRGYLARRAFRTLKGIIRLQAVIRGHFVRRQAVATLYCVRGIVKFQALVRGQMIRHSDMRQERGVSRKDTSSSDSSNANTCSRHEKLLKNAFIRQLLSSSPTVMPLRLQYDPVEPNSVWNWLLRWTMLRVWGLRSQTKETVNLKQKVETQKAGPKRNGQRKQSANVENASGQPTSDSEKRKSNSRKALNQSVKVVQEQTRNEVIKLKHNTKKLSSFASEDPIQKDTQTEKPKHNNDNEDKSTMMPIGDDLESGLNGLLLSDLQDKQLGEKNETIPDIDRDLNSVEERPSNENNRISKRRASLPAKHYDQETEQHGARVPSYMAATQSAKAKVRSQASARLGQDTEEKNGQTRRHSLPSSVNGKQNSSPRVQRFVQANGKGGIKIDRSLSSSRDNNDKIQAEWKR